ncbi:hypothetical protein C1645_825965 [Glomus cerebriforme]|uniref:Uncharacterized protein n=1 Tax=Glomus cerebriforme TaxID=658196 RepID=A0A397SRQ4_9GLOM|nr:hypothetical protein C1645_825965 [Glomus cerebriforme]
MNLDSRTYFKLTSASLSDVNFVEYKRIVNAIGLLAKKYDYKTPEMWYFHIRDLFRKILKENSRILSKNGYIIIYGKLYESDNKLEDEYDKRIQKIKESDDYNEDDENDDKDANKFLDEYVLSKDFAIRKYHEDYITLDDSSQRLVKRTYSCTLLENYKLNKVTDISKQCQRTSNLIGYS